MDNTGESTGVYIPPARNLSESTSKSAPVPGENLQDQLQSVEVVDPKIADVGPPKENLNIFQLGLRRIGKFFKDNGFLMLWILLQLGIFFGFWQYYRFSPRFSTMRSLLDESFPVARGAAGVLNINSGLILLPVCKKILSYFRNFRSIRRVVPFDDAIHAHKYIAFSILLFTLVHIFSHVANVIRLNAARPEFKPAPFVFISPTGATGQLATWSIIAIIATAGYEGIRRAKFEVFAYTHQLYILYYAAMMFHGTFCFILADDEPRCITPIFWMCTCGPLALMAFERFCAVIWPLHSKVQIERVVQHPKNVLELRFIGYNDWCSGLGRARPGQYVTIMCPQVSWFQWHPFTLTSCPEDKYLSVHISCRGDWTKNLLQKFNDAQNKLSDGSGRPISCVEDITALCPTIYVAGPYNSSTAHMFDYDACILVGAGVGVTPFASILRSLRCRANKNPDKLKTVTKVYFIWVCRNLENFEWFHRLLSEIEQDPLSQDWIQITLYWTLKQITIEDARTFHTKDQVHEHDPMTGLMSRTVLGRPQWPNILKSVAKEDNVKRAGVFVCGPPGLANAIQYQCEEWNGVLGTQFDFHKEMF